MRPRHRRRGFTMVELLVVAGITTALAGLLLPAINRSRDAARLVACKANLHQIVVALTAYASANGGNYPPNTTTPTILAWSDDERIGVYLSAVRPLASAGRPGGDPFVCPCDQPAARTSYAVNVWSGCRMDAAVAVQVPASARPWSARVPRVDQMILVIETYGTTGTANGWYAPPTVGTARASLGPPDYRPAAVTTAGQRFGGGGGVQYAAGPLGPSPSELCYSRHRPSGGPARSPTAPVGRLNLAYADGHVADKTNADLVGPDGRSTGDSWWSPGDRFD